VREPRLPYEPVFVAALVGTSAFQLRLGGLPLGPGEILMVLWWMLAGTVLLRPERMRPGPAAPATVVCWTFALAAVGIGALWGQWQGRAGMDGAGRDLLAIVFVFLFSLSLAALLPAGAAGRLAARTSIALAVFLGALLVAGLAVRTIGPFDLWYMRVRFVGLATNPNQLALFVAAAPFLLLQRLGELPEGARRWPLQVAIATLIAVGIATTSDALAFSWLACAGLVAAWVWTRALLRKHRSALVPLFGGILLPALIVTAVVLFGIPAYAKAERAVLAIIEVGSQASVRLALWTHGFEAFAQSPWVGWGPGAHSGVLRPFQNTECHNTYCDWLTVAGLMGAVPLFGLVAYAVYRAVATSRYLLAIGLLAVASFAVFHYILRQPMFWFYVIVVLAWTTDPVRRTDDLRREARR
jgi:O-antigen ligase